MTLLILIYVTVTMFINSDIPVKQAKINAWAFLGYILISIFWFFTISHWFIILTIYTIVSLIFWICRARELGKKEILKGE